uniref:CheR family methyltransferase n=1 Tax=Falsiroseomonas selenitidurans TaxID=2716335 RepID=UPI0038B3BA91
MPAPPHEDLPLAPAPRRFPIVGIGASAGGVQALQALFRAMPDPPPPIAFVVVTHLGPTHESALPSILAECTTMPVHPAGHGHAVQPGHVHVLPRNAIITIEGGRLVLRDQAADLPRERHPIDVFLVSLAADQQDHAGGVVLSGSGNDGTLGLKAIREAGGFTMAQGAVQEPKGHPEMPDSAIAGGGVLVTTPVEEMPARLADFAASLGRADPESPPGAAVAEATIGALQAEIAGILRESVGHDFSGYKDKTFFRRVQRRIQVLRLPDIPAYLAVLRSDAQEARHLFEDLLIGVTGFFRDPQAFEALAERVIPALFQDRGPTETIRIWVPGCATGEEAYSIAILLREWMRAHPGGARVQIFATDIDEAALTIARRGHYPAPLLGNVSAERLARFFVQGAASHDVAKELRDICVFSPHSLIADPPFSRIDMVCCRNLLIYLGSALQDRAMSLFHYALRPGGFLFLGISETLSRHAEMYVPEDKVHRIYRRREEAALPVRVSPAVLGLAATWPARQARAQDLPATRPGLRQTLEAAIVETVVPPHVVLTRDGDVVFQSAHLGKYLEPATGAPSRQVFAMARMGLRVALRSALREAAETGARAVRPRLEIGVDDRRQVIALSVEPLAGSKGAEPLYVALFSDIGPPQPGQDIGAGLVAEDDDSGATELAGELRDTREKLLAITEEYEAATEELTSANEEMVSVNEELQSTNEELETSKEELQSVNEELRATNFELLAKVEELDRANADLRNLFDSTQIATLFLDRHLLIRSFTPAVTTIFNLVAADRGRPIMDFTSRLDGVSMRRETRQALESREPVERRVTARDGTVHYLMRMLPYRTTDGTIDGLVLTFFDITKVVEGEVLGTMVHELNHRVRNMLQVVNAVAASTLRRAISLPDFAEAFTGRLKALGRAHELLAQKGWTAVDLKTLIEKEIEPYLDHPRRAGLVGPAVLLTSKAALALGMVLHELATNATKHGALSNAVGRIDVAWSIEGPALAQVLVLRWAEQGGPPQAVVPARRGFGTELIGRLLKYDLGGTMNTTATDLGRVVTLHVPLGTARADWMRVPAAPPAD